MDNPAITTLEELGLSPKEAAVYLAALSGTGTIAELAQRSQVKRPTVYVIVASLKAKGLLSESKQGSKEFYTAVSPKTLKDLAQRRLEQTEAIVPALEKLVASQAGRPKIEVFEGREGVKTVYQEMLGAKEILFASNIEGVIATFPEILARVLQGIDDKKITVREILEDSLPAKRYARKVKAEKQKNHEVRIAKGKMLFGESFTYGDVVALVSFRENNLFVVRVENADFAKSYRTLFDLAWQSAKRV